MSTLSLRKLFGDRNTHAARGRKARLGIDSLERRDVPASISFDNVTGVLTINGSSEDDVAKVSVVGSQIKATLDCYSSAPPNLSFFSDAKLYSATSVKQIKFNGFDGNDQFTNSTSKPSYADGGLGNDSLTGGSGADFFVGNYGDDVLKGNGGSDSLWGSGGHDKIYGGGGADVLKGHGGNDSIWGGTGRDSIFGGSGDDKLYGEDGMDTIVTIGGGTDTITGGYQWDHVWMDTTDTITDATPNEWSHGYIHQVDQFYSYSYNGGDTSTPVSKELNGQSLADPNSEYAFWINNFSDKSLFASNGPTANDIFQGDTGDCYFMARLSAIAKKNPEIIRNMVVDLGDGTYAVRFYRFGVPEYVRVDGDLYWDPLSGKPIYAKLGQQDSIWVPIVEKAYAFWRKKQGTYESISGGYGGFQHVTPELGLTQLEKAQNEPVSAQQVIDWVAAGKPSGTTKNKINAAVKDFLKWIKTELGNGNAVVVGAKSGLSDSIMLQLDDPNTEKDENTWRIGQHIFMVDKVLTDANGNPTSLVVRNPYGTQGPGKDGYITITDFSVIYFCIGKAASLQV